MKSRSRCYSAKYSFIYGEGASGGLIGGGGFAFESVSAEQQNGRMFAFDLLGQIDCCRNRKPRTAVKDDLFYIAVCKLKKAGPADIEITFFRRKREFGTQFGADIINIFLRCLFGRDPGKDLFAQFKVFAELFSKSDRSRPQAHRRFFLLTFSLRLFCQRKSGKRLKHILFMLII